MIDRLRAGLRTVEGREGGFTLIEVLIVVVIVGVMAATAIGSLGGVITGLHDSAAQSTLQAARVALAGATVSYGAVPTTTHTVGGVTTVVAADLAADLVPLPSNDDEFRIGYMPFCYQVLNAAGSATNTTLHAGLCTTSDKTAVSGGKPLVETDFVLCAKYGATGTTYIADTWHSVQPYTTGGRWTDGSLMNLHGCVAKPITDQGGVVKPQG